MNETQYFEDTNVTLDQLRCDRCGERREVMHKTVQRIVEKGMPDGILYTACSCGKHKNIPYLFMRNSKKSGTD